MRTAQSEVLGAGTPAGGNPGGSVFASRAHAIAGMKAAFKLMDLWGLGKSEMIILLGEPTSRTYHNWKNGEVKTVPADTLRRIGYLMGIHKGLRLLFQNPENIYGWVRRSNDDFGGQSPLQRMLGGDMTDLAYVRQYLDAARGGWV